MGGPETGSPVRERKICRETCFLVNTLVGTSGTESDPKIKYVLLERIVQTDDTGLGQCHISMLSWYDRVI